MASRADHTQPTATELADLSALADGTLDPARHAEVQARIQASPELTALYERERGSSTRCTRCARPSVPRRGCGRGSTPRVRAAGPSRAGDSFTPAVSPRRSPPWFWRSYWRCRRARPAGRRCQTRQRWPLAGRHRPRRCAIPRARADGSTRASATSTSRTGPRGSAGNAVGARTDTLGGHSAVTVYYEWKDATIAYTIVHSPPLAQPSSKGTDLHGTELRTLEVNGRLVVTWRRDGDTCVLSGTGVTASELQRLAAWKVPADSSD